MSETLQDYLQSISVDGDELRQILTTNIRSSGLPIDQTTLEFIAVQLGESIGDPFGRERREEMQRTLQNALADGEMTLLEIIETYPDPTTRISLHRLVRLHTDLTLFVERIEPILGLVKQLLPELICDCDLEAGETSTSGERSQIAAVTPFKTGDRTSQICSPSLLEHQPTFPSTNAPLTPILSQLAQIPPAPSSFDVEYRFSPPPPVAETVIVAFGILQASFQIAELEQFIATGVAPIGWQLYFDAANLEAEEFRAALTQEVAVNITEIDGFLENILGEYLLFQAGTVIHPPSNTNTIQALRSALLLSAANDGKISLFEVLRNYPTTDVIVEGINLARFGSNLGRRGIAGTLTAGLEDMLLELQGEIADDICPCALSLD